MTAVATAEVFFANDVLGVGDVGYGAMVSAWTLGMVLGATALPEARAGRGRRDAARRRGAGDRDRAARRCGRSSSSRSPRSSAAARRTALKNVLLRTLIHRRTPEHLHGRAFAAYNGLRNAAELSALSAGGVLVAVAGPRATMAIAGPRARRDGRRGARRAAAASRSRTRSRFRPDR